MNQEEIIVKLTEHGGQIDRHEGRIKCLEKEVSDIHRLTTSVEVLAEKQNTLVAQLTQIGKDVQDLKEKPAKRWDLMVAEIIKAIVEVAIGGGFGYLLAMIFSK